MGIKGLTTYLSPLKNHDIAEFAVKINDLKEACSSLANENAVLMIDGNSLIYHIIVECKLNVCIARHGGTYWQFEKDVEDWLSKLKAWSLMKLVVFTDGVGEQQKTETHRERATNRANKVWSLSQSMSCGTVFVADDFIARMNMGLYIACLSSICRKLNIEFTCCIGEADLHIARITLQNKFFACLSNDSDFFCLQIPYIPLTSVKFLLETKQVAADLYKPENIIKVLQLNDVELLPHFACLVGNDFLNENDVRSLHEVLKIPHNAPSSKNIIYHIQSVLVFLKSFRTSQHFAQMLQKYQHKNEPLFEKYNRALAQYAVHIPPLEYNPLDDCVYETARKNGVLFGLSLKLYHFKPLSDSVFQSSLPLHLIALSKPFDTSLDIPQYNVVAQFQTLRNKIIDVKLGGGVRVESEQWTTRGEVVWKHTTQAPPDFTTQMERFLWILAETDFTADTLQDMFQMEPKTRVFAILTLRALCRVEHMTLREKTAILCHLYPQPHNIAMSSWGHATNQDVYDDLKIDTRIVQLVSLFEYCLCLCVDANLCCGAIFGNVLHVPSDIIDGQRLSSELRGTFPPDLGEETLHFLQDDSNDAHCKYDDMCRFTKCAKIHSGTVFGRCAFDGTCNRHECASRHLLQPSVLETICKFDGMCVHFEKCRFKHKLQTSAFPVSACRFDGSCMRFPNCLFQHHKQHMPLSS